MLAEPAPPRVRGSKRGGVSAVFFGTLQMLIGGNYAKTRDAHLHVKKVAILKIAGGRSLGLKRVCHSAEDPGAWEHKVEV